MDAGSRGYELVLEDGRIAAGLHHMWPGNSIKVRSQMAVPMNEWVHIAMTYNGSSRAAGVKIFVNGLPIALEVIRDGLWNNNIFGVGNQIYIRGVNQQEHHQNSKHVNEWYQCHVAVATMLTLIPAGPLLRAEVLRLRAEEHVLLLNVHHIASDGWSSGILERELAVAYNAFVSGHEPELPALPVQYADYAVWQRDWLRGEVLEKQLAYWRPRLADVATLELLTDRPRPPIARTPSAVASRVRRSSSAEAWISRLAARSSAELMSRDRSSILRSESMFS